MNALIEAGGLSLRALHEMSAVIIQLGMWIFFKDFKKILKSWRGC